ncbi:MAG: hypothetical protein WA873_04780 [Jannaschia helgolandensis]
MIRPEVAALMIRWREALIGGGAIILGLGLWIASGGLIAFFGAVAMTVGAFLLVSGIRAARFRTATQSPGVVEVDEGRITYLGPILGGSVELDELTEVAFLRTRGGEAFWRLAQFTGQPLMIPEGAAGSDKLLDALAPLPGLDTGAMVRAVQSPAPATITVWRRTGHRALT